MECIERLHGLCARADISGKKNGTTLIQKFQLGLLQTVTHEFTGSIIIWGCFLDELLDLLVQHRRLVVSDMKFLASLLSATLSPLGTTNNLLVPQNVENR